MINVIDSNILTKNNQSMINYLSMNLSEVETNSKTLNKLYNDFYNYFCFGDFNISIDKYLLFINEIKDQYLKNPYHSFSHAIDACTTLMYILSNTTLKFSNLDRVSLFIAMLCHDTGHFGKTGLFVSEYRKDIVDKYGSNSLLEQYHLYLTMETIKKTKLLETITEEQIQYVYNIVSKTIIATDPLTTNDFIKSESDLYKLVIKCSDIGSSVKTFDVHEIWVKLLIKEFYSQGDELKLMGKECISLFDSNKICDIASNQNWYFCNYAIPLYNLLNEYLCDKTIITNLMQNFDIWKLRC